MLSSSVRPGRGFVRIGPHRPACIRSLNRERLMPDISNPSTHLSLPYIQPAQAQKHVTHNEALRRLDALVQLSVLSASVTAPPASHAPDARYILPAGTSGGWAGQPEGTLAVHEDVAWAFYTPQPGWRAWVEDSAALMVFDGSTWGRATGTPDYQNLPQIGVQTSADAVNRLAVASEATLLTHAGAGHQLKINKSTTTDTASLLFQTGWSGRAEMGTTGADDFEIKVSADGSTFHSALVADATTGRVSFPQGADGLAPVAFGPGALLTTGYAAARGGDLVTNGTGLLGNAYNYPTVFTHDPVVAPNLPASHAYAGYSSGVVQMEELLPIDPNQVYRLGSYLRQEDLPGDWSSYPNGCRHVQYMGLDCFDRDGLSIQAQHHMRYRHAGTDSLTTLAAPLAPGDTVVHLTNAAGWNHSKTAPHYRGLILFGYRNSHGFAYDQYSRLVEFDLFENADLDKSTNIVTLNKPLPATLANPDESSGVWPAGTAIANCSSGMSSKYAFYSSLVPPQADRWYRTTGHIGGIDRSGTNIRDNFPPGTAFARVFWLANHTNIPGGSATYPDTGPDHRIWFSGVSVTPEPLAVMQTMPTGAQEIKVPRGNYAAETLSLVPAAPSIDPL